MLIVRMPYLEHGVAHRMGNSYCCRSPHTLAAWLGIEALLCSYPELSKVACSCNLPMEVAKQAKAMYYNMKLN